MPKKIHDADFSDTPIWITRDKKSMCGNFQVELWTSKPFYNDVAGYYDNINGTATGHIEHGEFKDMTGINVRKGQMIGPVHLGIVYPNE